MKTTLKKPIGFLYHAVNNCPKRTLVFLILLSCGAVFFPYLLFKDFFLFNDIGSDTVNVYYPFLASLQRKVSSGDFTLWDFTHGLGTNAITRQADIGSVFTWILCLFRAEHLKYGLILMHLLKVVLTGVVGYLYLDCFVLSNKVKITASYVFAFNGFVMLWGQHYFFATACATACFLLYAIEKCLVSKKGYLLFALAVFFSAFNSYYYAYMTLLMAAVYALFRLIATHRLCEIKQFFAKIGRLFGAVVLGIGLAACLFLPSINTVLSTSARLSGEMSLVEKIFFYLTGPFYDRTTANGILARFFSNNLYGIGGYEGPMNYYEMPQWFFSSFLPFFAALFVLDTAFNKALSRKAKVLKLSGVVLLLFLAFHPFLSVVINGFVAPFFRYTYLVMPLFALCMAQMLEKLFARQISKTHILLAGLFETAALAYTLGTIPSAKVGAVFTAAIYLLMAVGLIVLFYFLQNKRVCCRVLSVTVCLGLIVANVTMDSYFTNNRRAVLNAQNSTVAEPSGNRDVHAALEYLRKTDTSFFRTDKTFQDIAYLNDSMLQGYYGVSVYNSVINKDVIEFVQNVCPEFNLNPSNSYFDVNRIIDNPNVLSLLGVKYILTKAPLENAEEYELIHRENSVSIYRNTACEGIGKIYTKAVPYEAFAALSPEEKNAVLGNTLLMDKAFSGTTPHGAAVRFERPEKQSFLTGTVTVDQNALLMLPIPNEDGWTAFVDGKAVQIKECDYAFMALEIKPGKHTVELRYKTPFFAEGLLVSAVSFSVYGLLWLLVFWKKKKQQNVL